MHKHSRILLVHSHHNTNGTNAPKLQTQFGDEHFKTKPLQPSRFTFRIQPLSPGALLPRNGVLLFLGKAYMSSEQANCKYNFHQPYAHLVDNQPRPQQANANAPVFCPEPTPFVSFVHPVPKATNNCEKYAQAIVSLFRSLCSCFFLSPRLCTSVPCTLQSSCVKSFVQISVFFVWWWLYFLLFFDSFIVSFINWFHSFILALNKVFWFCFCFYSKSLFSHLFCFVLFICLLSYVLSKFCFIYCC